MENAFNVRVREPFRGLFGLGTDIELLDILGGIFHASKLSVRAMQISFVH